MISRTWWHLGQRTRLLAGSVNVSLATSAALCIPIVKPFPQTERIANLVQVVAIKHVYGGT